MSEQILGMQSVAEAKRQYEAQFCTTLNDAVKRAIGILGSDGEVTDDMRAAVFTLYGSIIVAFGISEDVGRRYFDALWQTETRRGMG